MLNKIDVAGLDPREFQRLQHPPKADHTAEERLVSALEQIGAALCRIDHRLTQVVKRIGP